MELYHKFEVVAEPNERRACCRSKYFGVYGFEIWRQAIANSNAI